MSAVSWRDKARPRPRPLIALRSSPSRSNGVNKRARCAGLRPGPVSRTLHTSCPSACCKSTSTWPPGRLYLTALDSRLTSTCMRRRGSARTSAVAGCKDCAARLTNSTCGPSWPAATIAQHSASSGARSSAGQAGWPRPLAEIEPDTGTDKSSKSSTRPSRCRPLARMWPTQARCWAGVAGSTSINWAKPSTAFSGVRSSWLTRDSSAPLARSAARAWSRAARSSSPRLRSLMSVWVPIMRSGRPAGSRRITMPRDSTHFQLPSWQRMRCSLT